MHQAAAKDTFVPPPSPSAVTPEGASVSAAPDTTGRREQDIEQARQDLLQRLLAYQPVKDITNLPKDRLNDRYTIHCDRPLNQFAYGNVRAYAVSDDKSSDIKLYAAICDPARPYRYRVLQALENFDHPHLARVIGHGVTNVSALGEYRYVIVFEQPGGRPLSEILKESKPYNERSFTEQILKPLASVITAFEGLGINHGRITPDNIFVGEKTILGECICEPPGFSKDFLYEPIERLLTAPQGTGGGTTKVDTFDLGILAIETLSSLDRQRTMNKDVYAAMILNSGTYNILTPGASFGDGFTDFLVGTLNDSYEERWSSAPLNLWLGGKRFNLLKPSPPRESSRPFEFDGEQFFNTRALAHSINTKWETARGTVRDAKIDRWLEQGVHKRDVAERVRRAISATGGAESKNPRQNSEFMSRLICLLDPAGPIRLEHLSFNLGGLALLLSDAVRNKKQKELALIRDVIDYDLLTFWSEIQTMPLSEEANDALWKIQKHRHLLTVKSMGFGMERLLYDLNPHLPCLSAMFAAYHVSTLPDMLYALDALARSKAKEGGFTERHLAAFIASHAGVLKEPSVKDLRHHAHLLQNPEIVVMILLAKAQEKAGIKQLRGLACWTALRVLEMTRNIHSMQTRKIICRDLVAAAEHGHVGLVLQALLNMKLLNNDLAGFEKATETFQHNRQQISEFRNQKKIREKAQSAGLSIATMLSILLLGASIYTVIEGRF